MLKTLGGYRQQLEWVPFFFFGYLMIRSKHRFRQLFLILGVIALANGVVGAVQARLSPGQLASWGPGYRELVDGGEGNGITARTYAVEGVAHVRPPALGSDAGFGGSVGTLALPGLLALLPLGDYVGDGRSCALSGRGARDRDGRLAYFGRGGRGRLGQLRPAVVLRRSASEPAARGPCGVAVLAFAVGSVLISTDGSSIFARQETLTSLQRAEESGGTGKERSLGEIPHYLVAAPFGFGLGIDRLGFRLRRHASTRNSKGKECREARRITSSWRKSDFPACSCGLVCR